MHRKKSVYLEESLLEGLDGIIKKVNELQELGYEKWDLDRTDLIKFAVASTYGLAYPYTASGKKNLKKILRKVTKR